MPRSRKIKRKQYYFICRRCYSRLPVERESVYKVGMCIDCYIKSQEIAAEFLDDGAED